jgi:hypothetical protein
MSSADDRNERTTLELTKLADFVASLSEVGAQEYANGRYRGAPLVDAHFTPGSQERYGWPDLSPEYEERKRLAGPALRKGMRAAGRKVSKFDEDKFGGNILPMLVLTGALRQAVTSKTHKITRKGDVATIVFDDLPEYALAHHTGNPGRNLPKRSPVEPGPEDLELIEEAMERHLALYVKAARL